MKSVLASNGPAAGKVPAPLSAILFLNASRFSCCGRVWRRSKDSIQTHSVPASRGPRTPETEHSEPAGASRRRRTDTNLGGGGAIQTILGSSDPGCGGVTTSVAGTRISSAVVVPSGLSDGRFHLTGARSRPFDSSSAASSLVYANLH